MLQSILGDRAFIVKNYVDETISLTKSMSLVNNPEAKIYNLYLKEKHPTHNVNVSDKKTWRYYKHLCGVLHPLDTPVVIKSIDNLSVIELTRDNLLLYKKTREELLKFGRYYKDLVAAYPTYELYIKAVITDRIYTIDEIVNLEELTIVSYNNLCVEEQELDIIDTLQHRLYNYKVTWNLTYYAASDTLFLASQTAILYLFIVNSLIAIRLKNAKTINAHSFHIKNYLSSHHYLDEYYIRLNKEQRLFLYRNLLYINNHVGTNEIFELLIKKLFIDRKIPISKYDYHLTDSLDDNRDPTYRFNRVYFDTNKDYYNYNLQDIITKENKIVVGNSNEWQISEQVTNSGLSNTLFNHLTTKDLETTLYDYTDNVKYKLLETILDYTAYTCKNNTNNFNVGFTNASNTVNFNIHITDAFRLITLLLYKYNGEDITTFAQYRIKRVRKPTLPPIPTLLSKLYSSKNYYQKEVEKLQSSFITYPATIVSTYQLYEFVNKQYLHGIGLWIYLSNIANKDTEGQLNAIIDEHYITDLYDVGTESVSDFISRVGVAEINNYTKDELMTLFIAIVNAIYDNRYNDLFSMQFVQKALIGIFSKFKSYTVQIVDEYSINNITLTGNKDARYSVAEDINIRFYFLDSYIMSVVPLVMTKLKEAINLQTELKTNYSYKSNLTLQYNTTVLSATFINTRYLVNMYSSVINTNNPQYTVRASSQEDLLFLAAKTTT